MKKVRRAMLDEFQRVSSERQVTILAVEAIEDHVHLLVDLRPDQTLPVVMHDLKGASARAVFQKYPELKLDMHSNSFWQKGYGSGLVPPNEVNRVRRYIETQEQRPLHH